MTTTVPSAGWVPGVAYLLDGEPVAPGTHPAAGAVVVTAQADPPSAYHLADGAAARWEHTFDTAEAAPAASGPAGGDEGGLPGWLLPAAGAAVLAAALAVVALRRRH